MRKDLRVGLGIGGVVLAVLVVAIIVRSHGKDKKLAKGNDTVSPTDSGDFTGEPTPSGDPQPPNATPEPGVSGAPGDGRNGTGDPFEPEGTRGTPGHGGATANGGTPAPVSAAGGTPDDWEKILNASNPGPIRSMTPAQSGTNPGGRSAASRTAFGHRC